MMLAIAEAQATEDGFAEQTAAYQVTRAYWKASDWRRHLTDREAKHTRLDTPATAATMTAQCWPTFCSSPRTTSLTVRMAKTEIQEALATLATKSETGRKKAEILYRRFYGDQTVAEASKEHGYQQGNRLLLQRSGAERIEGHPGQLASQARPDDRKRGEFAPFSVLGPIKPRRESLRDCRPGAGGGPEPSRQVSSSV